MDYGHQLIRSVYDLPNQLNIYLKPQHILAYIQNELLYSTLTRACAYNVYSMDRLVIIILLHTCR